MRKTSAITILLFISSAASAACFEAAANRYRLPTELLKAISSVESSGNPNAINRNTDGSRDIGHMQINSRWLPALKAYGINEQALFDPCINTHVGAWILAQNVSRLGYGWVAVGAYNAGNPVKRMVYAQKVAAVLRREGRL